MSTPLLRPAQVSDASALLDIYRPYVEAPGYCFELECPSAVEFAARIERAQAHWEWRVAEQHGQVVGYAYAGLHRQRAAYRYSCEVSAYVSPEAARSGIGSALYVDLLARLTARGYFNALAVIVLPNPASEAFHRCHGFAPVAVFQQAGYTHGRWWDVAWMHRRLRDGDPLDAGEAAA